MREKLTKKEQEQYNKLQEKKKRIQKQEREFWKEVNARKDEVLKKLGIEDNTEYKVFFEAVKNFYELEPEEDYKKWLDIMLNSNSKSYWNSQK